MKNISTQIRTTLAVSAFGLAMAQGAIAATVTFQQIDGYFEDSALTAGEFTALGTPFLGNYHSSATATINGETGYQTFCLELDEPLQMAALFDYTLQSGAIEGGVAGGNPDTLSLGSAWLYSQFAAGSLAGYDYTPGAGRVAASSELQEAFWWLEEEISLDTPNGNTYLAASFAQFGNEASARADASAGAYDVWVLNPTENGEPRQSSMVIQVPDGGLTLGLLGLSLLGIARLRQRFSTSG